MRQWPAQRPGLSRIPHVGKLNILTSLTPFLGTAYPQHLHPVSGLTPSLRFATGPIMSSALSNQSRWWEWERNECWASSLCLSLCLSVSLSLTLSNWWQYCSGETGNRGGRRAEYWRFWVAHSANSPAKDEGGHRKAVQPFPHKRQELHSNPSKQGGFCWWYLHVATNCISGSSQE